MMIKSLFEAAKMPETECSVDVSEPFQSRSGVYRTVPEAEKSVPEADLVHFWYTKQAENSVPDRWRREKLLVFLILAVVVIMTAYTAVDFRLTAVSVLMLTAYGIAADPLRLLRRKLSRNSRLIMGLAIVPIIVIANIATMRTIIVAIVAMIIAVLFAVIGNKHWRAAESYEMSRHVLKALSPDDNTNHRDLCLTAWQADGAREVVAAAAEMGAYGCTEIEWQVRKAAYTIGFCRASTITKKWTAERAKIEKDLAKAEADADRLAEELEAVEDYAKNYRRHMIRLKAAEEQARRGAQAESELSAAKETIRKLENENTRLAEANEELIKTAASPMIAEELAEQMVEKRLKEAAELGFSVRQTESYAGVSHRRAAEYLKEWKMKERDRNEL